MDEFNEIGLDNLLAKNVIEYLKTHKVKEY